MVTSTGLPAGSDSSSATTLRLGERSLRRSARAPWATRAWISGRPSSAAGSSMLTTIAPMLKPLGYKFPFAVIRGYHRHYRPAGNATLLRPVLDLQNGFVITPMDRGIRLTSGWEFADRDAPATPVQLNRVLPLARELFPLAEPVDFEAWLGRRPCLPDSFPLIGPAPRHPGHFLDFGHSHLGFTLGPVTGRLAAEMIVGERPQILAAHLG